MITVRQITSINQDFLSIPIRVNRSNENFVPALQLDVKSVLDLKHNPFWKEARCQMFIVYKEKVPVARGIVHISDKHQELYGDDCAYFGYVDFIHDKEVFRLLMEHLVKWATANGAKKMLGPLNPSLNYELGVLKQGFDKFPCFMMTYNPEYYVDFYQNYGFKEAMQFYAYSVPNEIHREKVDRIVNLLNKQRNVRIKEIDFSNFKEEAILLCKIYNDSFKGHYGFIPFSEKEFLYVAKDMKMIMDKRLIFKVMIDNDPAGFILALPDMNEVIKRLKYGKLGFFGLLKLLYYKKRIKRVKVMLAAIKKKYQHLGLGSLLYAEMADRVKKAGYQGGELSWVAADNKRMNEIIIEMGGKKEKEYLLFELDLQSI